MSAHPKSSVSVSKIAGYTSPIPLVTAEHLAGKTMRCGPLDTYIKEQITAINSKLSHHIPHWGKNVVMFHLPVTFPTVGLARANAQKYVYARIIHILENEGKYNVRLQLSESENVLFIAWEASISADDEAEMNSTIARHRINETEAEELMKLTKNLVGLPHKNEPPTGKAAKSDKKSSNKPAANVNGKAGDAKSADPAKGGHNP
jgi:hypothetical protein